MAKILEREYRLHDVIAAYGLHTYHLDRNLTEEEADAICTACELIVGPSRDRWLGEIETEQAREINKTRAVQTAIEGVEEDEKK